MLGILQIKKKFYATLIMDRKKVRTLSALGGVGAEEVVVGKDLVAEVTDDFCNISRVIHINLSVYANETQLNLFK